MCLAIARFRDGISQQAEDRPGADGVALISEGFLKERPALGGDRGLSRRLELDGKSYEVIGVISESLAFPPGVRIWVPLALNPADRLQGGPVQLIRVVGRLRGGTTPEALSASLQTISGRSSQAWTAGSRIVILPLRVWLTGKTQQVWFILLGAVVAVLLIACANVAGLLMARGAGRRQEMAIRLALGAPVARLRRQLLTESLLLGLMGSARAWCSQRFSFTCFCRSFRIPCLLDGCPSGWAGFSFHGTRSGCYRPVVRRSPRR